MLQVQGHPKQCCTDQSSGAVEGSQRKLPVTKATPLS
jgi:hypothetical protein